MKIIKFETIPSTNLYLKENYLMLDDLTIVCSNHQTNGRGRLGRTWLDSDDLLFSILIKNNGDNLNNITDYSLLIASTLYKVLSNYVDNISIKWPNDILYKDKKLVGILLEGITTNKVECAIIGVGINVNSDYYSDEIKDKAISLKQILNKKIDKDELLVKINGQFKIDYNSYLLGKNNYLQVIRSNFYLLNKNVEFTFNGKIYKGFVTGISDKGNIIIEYNNEILEISSGEITLQNIYNK